MGLTAALTALAVLAWAIPTASLAPFAGAPIETQSSSLNFPTPIHHVLVVFLENEEEASVLQQGPFEEYLTAKYASAGQFYSVMHYSLPNYLAATSGYTTNLFKTVNVPNVGTLASAAGESWKSYMESMPVPCDTMDNGSYDVNHSPFVMYKSVLHPMWFCDRHVVGMAAWNTSFANGSAPNYGLVIPNLVDDGHNSNISTADAWLKGWLSPLINSTLFRSTAVFVLYDEGLNNDTSGRGNTTGGGHVYFAAVSPYARPGFVSQVQYNTFDLLTTTEWLLGLGRTGYNDNWTQSPPLTDLFNFSLAARGHGHVAVAPSGVSALAATSRLRDS